MGTRRVLLCTRKLQHRDSCRWQHSSRHSRSEYFLKETIPWPQKQQRPAMHQGSDGSRRRTWKPLELIGQHLVFLLLPLQVVAGVVATAVVVVECRIMS